MPTATLTGPHWTRRKARNIERQVQTSLNCGMAGQTLTIPGVPGHVLLPAWARGVRVQRVGRLAWQVEATSSRGH